jgi:nicotinate-nucleotide adenylyltransferase
MPDIKKYGILGGAFDPPHIAHSIIARDVMEQTTMDKIIFIPCGIPPLKNTSVETNHRLKMTELAFGNENGFEICDIEIFEEDAEGNKILKKEKSYTINTLNELVLKYGENVKWHLIIGIDNLIDFPKWKNPVQIFQLAEVIVVNRPYSNVMEVRPEFSEKVKFLKVPMLEISSTMVRENIKHKKSIKHLVLPSVEEYIMTNNLYT